jgi:hypothetical protein
MTTDINKKQQDILSGVYERINNYTRGKLTPSMRRELRDSIIEFQDSQDVVFLVDGELPKNPCDRRAEFGMWAIYHDAQQDTLKAGYSQYHRLVERE